MRTRSPYRGRVAADHPPKVDGPTPCGGPQALGSRPANGASRSRSARARTTDRCREATPAWAAASPQVLPDGMVIVAHFFDIESGRTDLRLRWRGHAHEAFQLSIHRDGGIDDLLDEAQ